MSFQTNKETKTPRELTPQQREDWRNEMEVAHKNGDKTIPFSVLNLTVRNTSDDYQFKCYAISRFFRIENGDGVQVFSISDTGDLTIKKSLTLRNTADDYQFNCYAIGKFYRIANGDGVQVFSISDTGDLTIKGSYSPFTGTHVAVSSENLKIGELVSLSSKKLNGKQPIWVADYCVNAKKGIFGVVYDVMDNNYLIAAVGDAVVNFSNENGECEPGDYLVPSTTKKGCVMVSKENFIPLNHCGKAGEACSENRLIAWVKE